MLRRFVRLPSEKRRLLACIHRVAHHRNTTRLLWLYDMRLPVNSMDAEELESFARVARSKQVTAVVADGLDPAHTRVGANVPTRVLEEVWRGSGGAEGPEITKCNRANRPTGYVSTSCDTNSSA